VPAAWATARWVLIGFGSISHFPYDAGHRDDVTYRSSESDAKRNPAARIADVHADRSRIPSSHQKSHAEPNAPPLKHQTGTFLCRSLDLGQSLALLEPPLLLQPHNLEPVEVGERLAALLLELLLGPVALGPLGVNTGSLPRLLDGTRPRAAGELVDNDRREESAGELDDAAGGGELVVCGGAINESLLSNVLVLCPMHHHNTSQVPSRCFLVARESGGSTYALVVDDLDNGGQAAALKLENTANLDATPARRSDIDRCHFGRRSKVVGRVSDSGSGGRRRS